MKIGTMKTIIATLGLIFGLEGSSAFAATPTAAVGPITTFTTAVQGSQEVLVIYFASLSGPSCGTSRYIYSSSQPNYKSVLATVMAAYFAGTSVYAQGAGSCSIWNNTEDLSYLCPGVGAGGC